MSRIDSSILPQPVMTGFLRFVLILATAWVMTGIVSYIYVDSLSFLHALIGTALLIVAQLGVARLVGFGRWHACILVSGGIVVWLIDELTNGLPTIMLIGSEVGVPKCMVSALGSLNEPTMEMITIPIFLLLVFGIGYKSGWLGLVLFGTFATVVPNPISVVLDNGVADTPPGADSWISLAVRHIHNTPGICVIVAIGMCAYGMGRWLIKRRHH